MTIPAIASYPLPEGPPPGRAPWRPDPERAVLLLHDMQDYFLQFFDRALSPIPEVLGHMQRVRAACHARGVPVLYTAQPSDEARAKRGLLSDLWGPGLPAHPERADIVSELRPAESDRVVRKTRYSAFHGTELLSLLRDARRDQLWICGVYAHIGCMLTAAEAFMNDIQPFVVADAVADFSRAKHDMALELVAGCCGSVVSSEALCNALDGGPTSWARAVLREELSALGVEIDSAREQDDLREHGLDSVRFLELTERLHERGLVVSVMDMMEHDSLAAMSSYLEELGSPLEPQT